MRRWESYSEFKDYTSDSSFLIRVQLSILLEKEIFEGKYILLHLLCLLHLMCFYRKKKKVSRIICSGITSQCQEKSGSPSKPGLDPNGSNKCIFVARFSFELLNNDHPCLLILMSSWLKYYATPYSYQNSLTA